MSGKEMWLPKTETKVTVTQDGTVNVWDEITMELRKLPRVGFNRSQVDQTDLTHWVPDKIGTQQRKI
jgi:hypothetical protein